MVQRHASQRHVETIFLVHPNALLRELFQTYLAEVGYTVYAYSPLESKHLRAMGRVTAEIVIVDGEGSRDTVFSAVGAAKKNNPEIRILLTARTITDQVVRNASWVKADGVVNETTDGIDPLIATIERIAEGESVFADRFTELMFELVNQGQHPDVPQQLVGDSPISDRELEVLRLLGQGSANQAIANQLHLSIYTVKNHVHNILRKLGVENRRAAVAAAIRLGLL